MSQDPLDRMLATWRATPPDPSLAGRIVARARLERPSPRTVWRGAAMLLAAGIAGFVFGMLEPQWLTGRPAEALAEQLAADLTGGDQPSWLFGAAGPLGGDPVAADGLGMEPSGDGQ